MGDTPFYKRTWFYFTSWLAPLLILYSWNIYQTGGFQINEVRIFFDILCILPLLCVLWMTFFSQFVLPLHKAGDRFRIFFRILGLLFRIKGPAIFIENGSQRMSEGEERRKGPGVLWLDSASAAVIRTATKIKRTIGPGVHFITKNESIAGTLDLHPQLHTVGPREQENPFAEKSDGQTDAMFNEVQDRRKQVSGWTRDGIEVVPNISVMFRVDTGFPGDTQPGSRFGYRTGPSPRDKKQEEADKKSIEMAILGEGINPHYNTESPYHRVRWNQLPAALAVDVWREYASKFTLQQFFEPTVNISVPVAPPPAPVTDEETEQLTDPTLDRNNRRSLSSALANIFRAANSWVSQLIEKIEIKPLPSTIPPQPFTPPPPPPAGPPQARTAFQAINEMVKVRLMQEFVESYDVNGRHLAGQSPVQSKEYEWLKARGLKVISVSISNPRLHSKIEDTLINVWKANWLEFIKFENDQIMRRQSVFEAQGQERAIRDYGLWLSQAVANQIPANLKDALKVLLMRTRSLILRNDLLRRKMNTELQELEDIIRWIEVNVR